MGEPSATVKEEKNASEVNNANEAVENVLTDLDNNEGENDDDKEDLDNIKAEEDDDHDHEGHDEDEKPDAATQQNILETSLCLKIVGFKRLPNLEEELQEYYKLFTKLVGIEAPLIEIPSPEDKWIYFEMKSLKDRDKLVAFAKKGPWDGQRLHAKIVSKPLDRSKDMGKLTVEEGLQILYPEKDTLYGTQLKTKLDASRNTVESVFNNFKTKVSKQNLEATNTKKFSLGVKEVVPMSPVDGYQSHITLSPDKNEATGEISYGVRVLSSAKDASVIVPLDDCISVPREMKLVAKAIISKLPDYNLLPYLPTNKDGDIFALSLRMSAYGSFMLTVIIPKVFGGVFRELTEEGVKLEENEEVFSVRIKKKLDDVKANIGKFYTDVGRELNINSVYMVMTYHQISHYCLVSSVDESYPPATHIFGQKYLPDKLNGINLRVSWDRDQHIDVFEPLLSFIEAQVPIHSSTRVYLVSPFRLLGLYFAKKCSHVTMFYNWTKMSCSEHKKWAKQLNANNIDFYNTRSQLKRRTFSNKNAIAIFWGFARHPIIEKLFKAEIYNMIFISYWNKLHTIEYFNSQKSIMENVYTKLKISDICAFDTAPYKSGYGLIVFYNGLLRTKSVAKKNRANEGKFRFARDGNPFGIETGLPESSQVSPFQRLGPVPFSRGQTYETAMNNRSDPWIDSKPPGIALRELDEVATGVMQNLQAVQQQMQAFIPSLMSNQQARPLPPPASHENSSGWTSNNKRRYNEDFTQDVQIGNTWNDNYSPYDNRDFKRRREDFSYNDNYQSNDMGGRWNQKETWGGNSANHPQSTIRTYGDPPQSWGNNSHEPQYYEKGRNINERNFY